MTSMKLSRRALLGAGAGAGAAWIMSMPAIAQSGPKRKVDIVMTQGVSGLTLHEMAKAQGYFDQFNIEPNVLVVSDGAKCVAALMSGASKICMWSGFNQLTPAIEKGAPLKILAGALNLPSLAFYTGKPEIKSVKDLEGKVLGIGALGSVLHQMTVLLLKKKGVNPDKVQFRSVGSNADIFKAVVARTVDAGLSDVDVMEQQERFNIRALPDGMLWLEIPEYTNQASYTSDAAIRSDRDGLVRTLAAYAKAYRFVCGPDSKDAFIKAREKVMGVAEAHQAETQWTWIRKFQPYAKDLVLSEEQINLVQNLNVEFKVQQQTLPFAKVADMSLATDALKLLA